MCIRDSFVIIRHHELEEIHSADEVEFFGKPNTFRIPVFIIGRNSGEALINFLNQGKEPITLSIHFTEIETLALGFEMFISAGDRASFEYIKKVKREIIDTELGSYVTVYPYFVSWEQKECISESHACSKDDCLGQGKYCFLNPEGKEFMSGGEVLYQHVFMHCVYGYSNEKWWDYAIAFYEKCFKVHDHSINCYGNQVVDVGIELPQVIQCVDSSFHNQDRSTADNTYLSTDTYRYNQWHYPEWPVLVHHRSSLNLELFHSSLQQYICNELRGLIQNTSEIPRICTQNISSQGQNVQSFVTYFLVAVIVISIGVVLFAYFRRKARRELSHDLDNQIQTAIAQYYVLSREPEAKK
eukprot:TRINITY_DN24624_c0_g1_i1.p1 TRINITY_DN24624_c0_g1~~TRINITY_DN24624_c0_g1_i1.p1  ORF type:complete len:375 (-),score=59.78 TRINITY_DN24624_c0_g1_i1:109-1173(-)